MGPLNSFILQMLIQHSEPGSVLVAGSPKFMTQVSPPAAYWGNRNRGRKQQDYMAIQEAGSNFNWQHGYP